MTDYKIGSIIPFGSYQWQVLDIKNNAALLVTINIIEKRPYSNIYKNMTWSECSLREYLNGEFYERFSETDKARIVPVINKNPDNPWFGTKGGEDTLDKIFLLSLEEVVCKYFGDSSAILYNRTPKQNYWFQKKDPNNSKREVTYIPKDGEERLWWWWIRTPGRRSVKAVYMHPDGNIGIQGNNIKIGNVGDGECKGGIRPALWMRLE